MPEARLSCVLKIGGSVLMNSRSYVDTATYIKERYYERGMLPFVVVSAMKGVTDELIRAVNGDPSAFDAVYERYTRVSEDIASASSAKKIEEKLSLLRRVLRSIPCDSLAIRDMVISSGEVLSKLLLLEALRLVDVDAINVDATRVILTDERFGDAVIIYEKTRDRLRSLMNGIRRRGRRGVPVVEGFMGRSLNGHITTLGRGGSDYTASSIAALLEIDRLYLVGETRGIMSGDPKYIPNPKTVPYMDYDEAYEASLHRVRGLNAKTFEPLRRYHASRLFIGDQRSIGTIIDRRLRAEHFGPKVIVYDSFRIDKCLGVIGKRGHVNDFLGKVQRLLNELGIRYRQIEPFNDRPLLYVYLDGDIYIDSLIEFHNHLFSDERLDAV